MSINSVTISGNLTRDPVYKVTQGGSELLEFGVAVNKKVRGSDGKWYDRAIFIECVIWGKRADAVRKYMAKGQKVCVHGELDQSTWKDKETGKGRSKLTVKVSEIDLGQTPAGKTAQSSQESQSEPAGYQSGQYNDEDYQY